MCVCAFPGIAVIIWTQNNQSQVHVPFPALQWSMPLSEHDVIGLVRMCAFPGLTVINASVRAWHYRTCAHVCFSRSYCDQCLCQNMMLTDMCACVPFPVLQWSVPLSEHDVTRHVRLSRCYSDHVQYGRQPQEVWWTGGPAVRVHGRLLQLGPQQTQRQVRGRVGHRITALCSARTPTLVYVHCDSLRGAMIMCFCFFVCLLFVDTYNSALSNEVVHLSSPFFSLVALFFEF